MSPASYRAAPPRVVVFVTIRRVSEGVSLGGHIRADLDKRPLGSDGVVGRAASRGSRPECVRAQLARTGVGCGRRGALRSRELCRLGVESAGLNHSFSLSVGLCWLRSSCLTRMESGSRGDSWRRSAPGGSESLAVAPNLVFVIFQSGMDLRRGRLFGGVCVLPLGFFNRLHRAPARAVGRARGPYGLSTARSTQDFPSCWVRCGCREPSRTEHSLVVARASLPGWSSAFFCRHRRSERCGSPKCAKGSRRSHPRYAKCYGTSRVSDGWSRFVVSPGTRPDGRHRGARVLRGAKDSLAPRGILNPGLLCD